MNDYFKSLRGTACPDLSGKQSLTCSVFANEVKQSLVSKLGIASSFLLATTASRGGSARNDIYSIKKQKRGEKTNLTSLLQIKA